MWLFHRSDELHAHLDKYRQAGKSIGFFPTMGALHQGHLSLLKAAKKHCDIVVCSIFVNPTQFNNPNDLAHYPRTPEKDTLLLENAGNDVLFLPQEEDLYGKEQPLKIDLGDLAVHFEGSSRPGHFQGVARVVRLLFDAVQPDQAFFGLKDYQQCRVVAELVKQLHLPVRLHFVATEREPDGLAMSSRNQRLTPRQRQEAPVIHKTLEFVKEAYPPEDLTLLVEKAIERINASPELRVDYFQIADAENLLPLTRPDGTKKAVALTAVYAGEVRLIDNLELN